MFVFLIFFFLFSFLKFFVQLFRRDCTSPFALFASSPLPFTPSDPDQTGGLHIISSQVARSLFPNSFKLPGLLVPAELIHVA